MSKLSDLIRSATSTSGGQPIGFAPASRRGAKPSLLIVARFASPSADAAKSVAGAADAALFAASEADRKLEEAVKASGGEPRPVGALPERFEAGILDKLVEMGVDFVALRADSAPAAALLHQKLGRILVIESEMSDTELRTLEPLPLDALLVAGPQGPLTVGAAMELVRVAGLARKPLIVSVNPEIDAADLEALREAGVVGVAVDGDDRGAASKVAGLRERIAALPPRKRSRDERADALLPGRPAAAHAHEEEDDDYEEDD